MEITEINAKEILDAAYEKALSGIPKVSKSCKDLAEEYLEKFEDPKDAAKDLISKQVTKCTASGFVAGLGGLITMPVTLPANITSVLYIQLRMIAALAAMGGFNPDDDYVQTLVYLCLVKEPIAKTFRQFGIKFGEKALIGVLKKVPGKVFININKTLGFRFITKFGEKGLINLGKMIPAVGGVIGGGIDFLDTKVIGVRAYKVFIEKKFD